MFQPTFSDGNVLLTSYGTFAKNRKHLVDKDWHYVILDEGHKIRNPEAQVVIFTFSHRNFHLKLWKMLYECS